MGRHGTRRLMAASIEDLGEDLGEELGEELGGGIGITIKARAFHYLLVFQCKESERVQHKAATITDA